MVVYAITFVAGLVSLQSPEQPIGDPLFSILEILIIVMMPVLVALMVAVHAWASPDTKTFSLMALVFMGLLAGLTSSVHFVILTVSRVRRAVVAASVPGVQVALGRIRPRHPRVGRVLPVGGVVGRASFRREPLHHLDSR
jgi:hypothetical protein